MAKVAIYRFHLYNSQAGEIMTPRNGGGHALSSPDRAITYDCNRVHRTCCTASRTMVR